MNKWTNYKIFLDFLVLLHKNAIATKGTWKSSTSSAWDKEIEKYVSQPKHLSNTWAQSTVYVEVKVLATPLMQNQKSCMRGANKADIKNKRFDKSALTQHTFDLNHRMDWDNSKVLEFESIITHADLSNPFT